MIPVTSERERNNKKKRTKGCTLKRISAQGVSERVNWGEDHRVTKRKNKKEGLGKGKEITKTKN